MADIKWKHTTTNQQSAFAVGKVTKRRHAGDRVCGGMPIHHFGCQIKQQKLNKNTSHLGLRQPPSNNVTNNNKQKVGFRKGDDYKEYVPLVGSTKRVEWLSFLEKTSQKD